MTAMTDEGRRMQSIRAARARDAAAFVYIFVLPISALLSSPPVYAVQVDQDFPAPSEDRQEHQWNHSVPKRQQPQQTMGGSSGDRDVKPAPHRRSRKERKY